MHAQMHCCDNNMHGLCVGVTTNAPSCIHKCCVQVAIIFSYDGPLKAFFLMFATHYKINPRSARARACHLDASIFPHTPNISPRCDVIPGVLETRTKPSARVRVCVCVLVMMLCAARACALN